MATQYPGITNLELYEINGTDCIGDSRAVINNNTELLGTTVMELSTQLDTRKSRPTTTLGSSTLVRALSVFSPTGTYLGFLPIYK